MVMPTLTPFNPLAEVLIHQYERYNPSAFDESLSLVQKVNKVIIELNKIGKLNNEIVVKWNEVMQWILDGGLEDTIITRLNELVDDGTMATLINQVVFADFETRLSKLEKDFVIASDFGALGDSTLQTTALQDAVNYLNGIGGGTLYLPKGSYVVDGLTLYPNVSLKGDGINVTKLIKQSTDTGGTQDKHLISGVDIKNISLDGISFIHQNGSTTLRAELVKFSTSSDQAYSENISVKHCSFEDSKNGRANLLLFMGLCKNIDVENNVFKGFSSNETTVRMSSLKFDNVGYYHNDEDWVFVNNNIFIGNKQGLGLEGVGYVPNIECHHNFFKGQTERGMMIYHGLRYNVTGNHFEDITAIAYSNNDGGAVWLDVHSPEVTAKSCVFANNTIQDIVGNALLLEEFMGIVANNEITNISKRSDTFSTVYDYESVQTTLTSQGGHGIHVTGGCRDFLIEGNKLRNISGDGINVNRGLGIQKTAPVYGDIKNNKIQSSENGIGLYEKISELNVMNNTIDAGTSGIRVTRSHATANNLIDRLVASGNTIKGVNGISKSYGLNNYGYLSGNTIQFTSGVGIGFDYNLGLSSGNLLINDSTKAVTVA